MEKKELTAEEIKAKLAEIVQRKWKRVENCKRIAEYYGRNELNEEALEEAKTEWIALSLAYSEIFGGVV